MTISISNYFFQVFYLNCIRILLQHGANPNCSYRSNLTPLHVLIFTVSENFTLNCDIQKRANFDFIKNILLLLLQHGLDCNKTSQYILQSIMDMIHNVRTCPDILCVYELTLILIQYGTDTNISLNGKNQNNNTNNLLIDLTINTNQTGGGGNSNGVDGVGGGDGGGVGGVGSGSNSNGNSSSGVNRNSFRNSRSYILFYYNMLITKKEFLLTDPLSTYIKIIYLFYYSMQHEPLYNCMKSLHNLYIAQVPNKITEGLIQTITTLYKRPRTLKQMCRVSIHESLNKKLAQNINRLNLPPPLKEYMLNFEA